MDPATSEEIVAAPIVQRPPPPDDRQRAVGLAAELEQLERLGLPPAVVHTI